ncbi:unnamed protein product [Protopolystoma xenopodis]|uniref:Uncharacterized protein n=1 Tax=Protopolystoma xenopodis TaxID=117903 RepID=A0A448XAM6_9PLAT|nr:unnamed protein product [Protopolystoma xenopodis]
MPSEGQLASWVSQIGRLLNRFKVYLPRRNARLHTELLASSNLLAQTANRLVGGGALCVDSTEHFGTSEIDSEGLLHSDTTVEKRQSDMLVSTSITQNSLNLLVVSSALSNLFETALEYALHFTRLYTLSDSESRV